MYAEGLGHGQRGASQPSHALSPEKQEELPEAGMLVLAQALKRECLQVEGWKRIRRTSKLDARRLWHWGDKAGPTRDGSGEQAPSGDFCEE
ncbi:hypothetical protein NDU88_004947 [Pleurodeles waltl]|uniref:Uncharacterized protein n=1 Tax=Pleurodeles waltl TaxID=8319 RepID=A0AAV7MWD4_PLEWA|nr:hypothetical protein NDU88_004947 [Pleurodeles waltl]